MLKKAFLLAFVLVATPLTQAITIINNTKINMLLVISSVTSVENIYVDLGPNSVYEGNLGCSLYQPYQIQTYKVPSGFKLAQESKFSIDQCSESIPVNLSNNSMITIKKNGSHGVTMSENYGSNLWCVNISF